jgi:hypothetical protein
MADCDYKKIAQGLGLEELGEKEIPESLGGEICPRCKCKLRVGRDRADQSEWSYCPKCKRLIERVSIGTQSDKSRVSK